jgi:ABC-type multidrug transport system fused ATPase/permease subunit
VQLTRSAAEAYDQTAIAVFEELRPVLLSLPESIAECLQQILSAKRIGAFILTRDVDYLSDSPIDAGAMNAHEPTEPLYVRGTIAWDTDRPDPVDGTAPTQGFRLQDIDLCFPRGQVTLIAGKFGSGKTLLLLAMMGEAKLMEGKISYAISQIRSPNQDAAEGWGLVPAGVAYVPQTPWLQSQSIRYVLTQF